MTYVPRVHENSKFIKQGEQEQVQSAGGYHLISNQENGERKKKKKKKKSRSLLRMDSQRDAQEQQVLWHRFNSSVNKEMPSHRLL